MNYPLINGYRHSFASIELNVNGRRIVGFAALNYSDSVERGKVRGNHPVALGMTRGDYDAEASLTLYNEEWDELATALGDGLYDAVFDITATFADDNAPTVTDKIIGCRFKKIGKSNSQGTDGTTVEKDLDLDHIEWSGKKPFKKMPQGTGGTGGGRPGRPF